MKQRTATPYLSTYGAFVARQSVGFLHGELDASQMKPIVAEIAADHGLGRVVDLLANAVNGFACGHWSRVRRHDWLLLSIRIGRNAVPLVDIRYRPKWQTNLLGKAPSPLGRQFRILVLNVQALL